MPWNRPGKRTGRVNVTDNSRTYFRETSGKISRTFRKLPETFRKKSNKEKKSKEKENKEKSSSIPLPTIGELTEEEAKYLLSSTPLGRNKPETTIATGGNTTTTITGQRPPQVEAVACEQKPRNPKGLIEALSPYNLSPRELEEVLKLSGHGEIGNPVWQILGEMHGNKRLRMPRVVPVEAAKGCRGGNSGQQSRTTFRYRYQEQISLIANKSDHDE